MSDSVMRNGSKVEKLRQALDRANRRMVEASSSLGVRRQEKALRAYIQEKYKVEPGMIITEARTGNIFRVVGLIPYSSVFPAVFGIVAVPRAPNGGWAGIDRWREFYHTHNLVTWEGKPSEDA